LNVEVRSVNSSSWTRRLIRYGPFLAWICLIFFFSSTAASATQTSRIIGPLLHFLFPAASPDTLQQYHFLIRKCAHVTEYAILAFFTVRALARSNIAFFSHFRFLIAVLVVLLIASLDEINQSYESTRTGTPWDVALDLAGGAAMAAVLKMLCYRRKRQI
jgi:VanZ family protein